MLEFLTLKNLDMSDVRRKKHNIAGIINSPVLTFKYKTGRVLNRFGIVLPCLTNIICEIWSLDDETRPIFAENWKNLQLICLFGGGYGGDVKIGENFYKIFRVDSKRSKKNRYIWLSEDSSTFWVKPILQRDCIDEYYYDCDISWPEPLPIGDGILRKSEGSYVAGPMFKFMGRLHTDHFSEIHFPSLVEVYKKVKKSINGAIDLNTGNPVANDLTFER